MNHEPNNDPLSKIKHKLQDEISALEHELNLELPKELMKARAHGDLSENAEYKYAKERQGFVSARLGQLKRRMGDIGMLNLNNIPHDRAGYGSRVWLRDLAKAEKGARVVAAKIAVARINPAQPTVFACTDSDLGPVSVAPQLRVDSPNADPVTALTKGITVHASWLGDRSHQQI